MLHIKHSDRKVKGKQIMNEGHASYCTTFAKYNVTEESAGITRALRTMRLSVMMIAAGTTIWLFFINGTKMK